MNETPHQKAAMVTEFIASIATTRDDHKNEMMTTHTTYYLTNDEAALFAECRTSLKEMWHWREYARWRRKIDTAMAAIASIRATAVKSGEGIAVIVSRAAAAGLRGVIPHLVEYEVMRGRDAGRPRRRRA